MVEPYGEFKLNLPASKLGNLYDVGYHTGQVVRDKKTEIGQTLRTDFANGQALAGTARKTGQLGDGVLDIGGGVVREAGDYAGDVVMETSALGGNYLPQSGLAFHSSGASLERRSLLRGIRRRKSQPGAGQGGRGCCHGPWAMGKAGDGLSWAASKVADGVTWVADKAADGAAWGRAKRLMGVQWLGEKRSPANWFGAR